MNNTKQKTISLAVKLPLILFTLASPIHAATTYSFNGGLSNLGSGVAVWDTNDGVLSGTLTLTSANAPNILTAETSSFSFTYDAAVASEFEVVYVATGGLSGVSDFSLFVDDSLGSEFFFENANTLFVSGDATYGFSSGSPGTPLVVNDSGSGASNSFVSNAGGSQFRVEGEGADGWTYGWKTGGGGASGNQVISGSLSLDSVPEPSSVSLLALGAVAFGLRRKR